MSRKLLEAKEDLELSVIRALNGADLTVEEIDELRSLTTRELMVTCDLDHLMAEKVLNHVQSENLRMNAQNLQTRIEDYEDAETSMTRTSPVVETKIRSGRQLNALIQKLNRS